VCWYLAYLRVHDTPGKDDREQSGPWSEVDVNAPLVLQDWLGAKNTCDALSEMWDLWKSIPSLSFAASPPYHEPMITRPDSPVLSIADCSALK